MVLAGDERIAATTLHIPHPYQPGMAESWIESCLKASQDGNHFTYAVIASVIDSLVGVCSLMRNPEHKIAEIAYWIGVDYWNTGYGTEAAKAIIEEAFETLDINKVYAAHFSDNPASGRLMQKLGMKKEAELRKHVVKWGISKDLIYYGLLREER
jgi:RimJ/RimL family protein N-acetyltransferase